MALSLTAAEVLPGHGLGPILFSARPEKVETLLGEAYESSFTRDGEDSYVTLKYPDGVTFYFSLKDGKRLDSFEVNSRSAVWLFGEPLFPRTQDEVVNLLRLRLLDTGQEAIQVIRNESVEDVIMKVRALGADFYFDLEGDLQQVHWGVLFNERDEIAWPS
ncbi:MAG TPA: hypothetical protein VNM67_13750 [Thermoanaerobaculia bacterium]|jgi:hypothetical protein|nr:hypothetical protein [Thermoanaerobaculia bacterium]